MSQYTEEDINIEFELLLDRLIYEYKNISGDTVVLSTRFLRTDMLRDWLEIQTDRRATIKEIENE